MQRIQNLNSYQKSILIVMLILSCPVRPFFFNMAIGPTALTPSKKIPPPFRRMSNGTKA